MGRKRHPEHVNHERWLVSYADFITLLFAFFVVLFASSQADKKKQVRVARAMQSAFSDMGVFEPHSKTPPMTDNGAGSGASAGKPNPLNLPTEPDKASPLATSMNTQSLAQPLPATANLHSSTPLGPGGGAAGQLQAAAGKPASKTLDDVQRDLGTLLAKAITSHSIFLRPGEDGLVISLRETGVFNSGSADIRPSSVPLIQSIAAELVPTRFNLRVEGHSDNVPIHTAQFDSNWELSTTRSVRIARVLLQNAALDPARLSAAGYAQFHPIESNLTETGRAHNRRVDIVVLAAPPSTTRSR